MKTTHHKAIKNLTLPALAAALACGIAGNALAQSDAWPARPVTMIVPLSPGAAVDIETRMYAQKLSESMGRPFLVDYKPGAGTTIGAAFVVKSAPDGYTLLSMTPSLAVAPLAYPNLSFDPFKDLTLLSLMSKRPSMFVVPMSLPVKNMTEYVAYARANPGKLNVGTSGAGGLGELALGWLHQMANLKVQLIHYKGGAPSYTAVMAGEVHAVFGSVAAMMGNIKAGKAKALAVTTSERSSILPDLPTVAEQGFPGFEYAQWIGVAGPAGLPPAVVARLSVELPKAAKAPDILQKLSGDGTLMVGNSPEQFRTYFNQEAARWRKVVQDTGIKLAE